MKVFRGAMNEMISSMGHMQDLVYLPLSNVRFPAPTMIVYSQLIEIVTFEIFPTDDWYPLWFDLKTTKPFSTQFAAFDYGDTTFMLLIGSLWIFIVFLLLKYPLFFLVRGSKYRFSNSIANFLRKELFWTGPVDLLLTGYIEFMIASFVNCQKLAWVGWGIYVSHVSMLFIMMLLVFFPLRLMILHR